MLRTLLAPQCERPKKILYVSNIFMVRCLMPCSIHDSTSDSDFDCLFPSLYPPLPLSPSQSGRLTPPPPSNRRIAAQ